MVAGGIPVWLGDQLLGNGVVDPANGHIRVSLHTLPKRGNLSRGATDCMTFPQLREAMANSPVGAMGLTLTQQQISTLLDGINAQDRALQEPSLEVIIPLVQRHEELGGHYPHVFMHPRHVRRLQLEMSPWGSVVGIGAMDVETAVIVRTSPIDVAKTEQWEAREDRISRALGAEPYAGPPEGL